MTSAERSKGGGYTSRVRRKCAPCGSPLCLMTVLDVPNSLDDCLIHAKLASRLSYTCRTRSMTVLEISMDSKGAGLHDEYGEDALGVVLRFDVSEPGVVS